jgi:hypothetical protein
VAGGKAIKYAEETLGVHDVYVQAKTLPGAIEGLRRSVALKRRTKTSQEDLYTDAELQFIANKRGENSSMSQTAFEKFIKGEIHLEPTLRKWRGELADLNFEIESDEAAIRRLQYDLEIATARMTELGGYFAYLAAVKTAEVASHQPTHVWGMPLGNPDENWPPSSA